MQLRLIRADLGADASLADDPRVIAKNGSHFWKINSVIDADKRGVQLLYGNGDAEPADDEARAVCDAWDASRKIPRAEVLLSREMLANAIEPEDRERFRRGEILGYDENGAEIPGPNYAGNDEDDE